MIYALLPYYNKHSKGFTESLKSQIEKIVLYSVDRKSQKIYWTETMNYLWKIICKDKTITDNDVICILNNDISFDKDYFTKGSAVQRGEIWIPKTVENDEIVEHGIQIDWSKKKFFYGRIVDCFPARGIFMKVIDFRNSGGFNKWLPHYLADYEFSIRMIKRGLIPRKMTAEIIHEPHSKKAWIFSKLNPDNPIAWTIFLFKCCPKRYLSLNILKAWVSALR
jgi:hypothetical protein